MKSSIWLKIVIGTTIGGLCLVAFLNYYIDPCFHYGSPPGGNILYDIYLNFLKKYTLERV